ncbi:MAG: YceH family protein [Steroidobacteraceae bacterium]
MRIELDSLEARIIGCLIEKQITTPDQYPLSLNALVSACNQKSNRDPEMSLDEATVQGTVDALSRKHLVLERSGFGSRVPKYQHLFCNTEFGTLKFSPQELAIVCELLLRGPQTPGELRSRASRMATFADASQIETALTSLQERESGPLVARLPREPGRRDSRYMHLFSGEAIPEIAAEGRAVETPPQERAGESLEGRVARLETELELLRAELEELKSSIR